MKRTLEGTKRKRQMVSGFRARMATPGGREVLNRRRARGRHQLAITAKERAQAKVNWHKQTVDAVTQELTRLMRVEQDKLTAIFGQSVKT